MALPDAVASVLQASVARPSVGPTVGVALATTKPEELAGLGAAADFHGISGYVHQATSGLDGIPDTERERLRMDRERTVAHHLRTIADLDLLRQVFNTAGIPWLVVKGPTLSGPVHGGADLRAYGDLDVLVRPTDLHHALLTLEASGAKLLDHNWTLIRDRQWGEVHVRLPMGTVLDLHWHLLNRPRLRQQFPISLRQLFDNARSIDLAGQDVLTPSSADTIVYIALHTMLSGGHRLIWLKDLERLLSLECVQPEQVAHTARQWRAELALAIAVERVAQALGSPPMASRLAIQRRGAARLWLGLARAAWRHSPAQRQDGSGSLGRLVSRSTRDTGWASFYELSRRSVSFIRERTDWSAAQGDAHPARTDPRSGQYPSGGEAAKQAYLAEVARYPD